MSTYRISKTGPKSVPVRVEDMTLGDYLRWLASTMESERDVAAHMRVRAAQADKLTHACEKTVEHYKNMSGNPEFPISDKYWIDGALLARAALTNGGAA